MAIATNVKVGITVSVFIAVLSAVIIWLSQFNPGKSSYQMEGSFDNVGGLVEGSKVYMMGVKIGLVKSITPEMNRVRVLMNIESEIKIPQSMKLNITSTGIVGDKSVEFFKTTNKITDQFYHPGDIIIGSSPPSFEDIIVEGKKTMIKAQNLIGDPQLNENIKLISKNIAIFSKSLNTSLKQIDEVGANIKQFSNSAGGLMENTNNAVSNINGFVDNLEAIENANRQNVNNIITNAGKISKSLESTAQNLSDLLENPQNAKDLKITMKSIRVAADNIQHISKSAAALLDNFELISGDIRDVSGDSDLKNNLKDIIKNAKVISDTFANTLSAQNDPNKDKDKEKDKKERLNVEFKSEILGKYKIAVGNANTSINPYKVVIGNFNMLAHTGFSRFPFVQLGVEEIGEGNQFNMQAGFYPFNNFRFRVGIIKGQLGIGSNYFIESIKSEVITEIYDIGSPHVRLGYLQNIYQDYGLSFYWDNHFTTNINEFNLGVRWQPGLF